MFATKGIILFRAISGYRDTTSQPISVPLLSSVPTLAPCGPPPAQAGRWIRPAAC